ITPSAGASKSSPKARISATRSRARTSTATPTCPGRKARTWEGARAAWESDTARTDAPTRSVSHIGTEPETAHGTAGTDRGRDRGGKVVLDCARDRAAAAAVAADRTARLPRLGARRLSRAVGG